MVRVFIRSEGCEDLGITANTCGIAYIKVNGKDYSPHIRGHNVVVINAITGIIIKIGDKARCHLLKERSIRVQKTELSHAIHQFVLCSTISRTFLLLFFGN